MEDTLYAGGMVAENSAMLINTKRELHESRIKHQTLLNEYTRLAGFEQSGKASLDTSILQAFL